MTATMPEPPDRALVGLFDPAGENIPLLFERDDNASDSDNVDHWFGMDGDGSTTITWLNLLHRAHMDGRQVVRLYRADDPAVTGAFNAGMEAAAAAVEAHAESIDWYEGGGVWADALVTIERARNAALLAGEGK